MGKIFSNVPLDHKLQVPFTTVFGRKEKLKGNLEVLVSVLKCMSTQTQSNHILSRWVWSVSGRSYVCIQYRTHVRPGLTVDVEI